MNRHREEQEQTALLDWARLIRTDEGPLSHYLFAIPNGAYLGGTDGQRAAQMARLKRLGLRPGASDLLLALARGRWRSFYIEMKKPVVCFRSPNDAYRSPTEEQIAFGAAMTRAGHLWCVAFGFDDARADIEGYLRGRAPPPERSIVAYMGGADPPIATDQ